MSLGYENNPFVAWFNAGALATLGGTTPLDGGARANAVTGSTYDKWRVSIDSSGAANLQFNFGSAITVPFAAVAAHNIGTLGGTASIQRSANGVTYADAGASTITPTDNSPMAWRMVTTANAYQYWRLRVSGLTEGDTLSVGVVLMSEDLVIPQRFYQGFAPVLTPTEVQLQSNVSVGGELLGSSIISRGSTLAATIEHVDATFIRGSAWLGFQAHYNDGKGFFFGWRPSKYPQDIHYCARGGGTLRPDNSGPRDLMSIKFTARVYANG